MLFCINLDTVYKIGSLLISAATLIAIIVGYTLYLQNQFRSKQLEVVFELVSEIQNSFHYLKYKNMPSTTNTIVTLFDIAEMEEFAQDYPLYFWGADPGEDEKEIISWYFFYKYNSNPLLPSSIASALRKFNFRQPQQSISYNEINTTGAVLLGRKKMFNSNESTLFYFPSSDIGTCKGFKKSAKELKDSIVLWAKKYGLDDLNITTSHMLKQNSKR